MTDSLKRSLGLGLLSLYGLGSIVGAGIYVLVTLVAVLSVSPQELAATTHYGFPGVIRVVEAGFCAGRFRQRERDNADTTASYTGDDFMHHVYGSRYSIDYFGENNQLSGDYE